jgi:hypothetical protein
MVGYGGPVKVRLPCLGAIGLGLLGDGPPGYNIMANGGAFKRQTQTLQGTVMPNTQPFLCLLDCIKSPNVGTQHLFVCDGPH